MAAATQEILDVTKGAMPRVGTFPVAAGELILKGTSVALNATDYAVEPTDGDGFQVIGVAASTVNNTSGAAGDVSVQVEYGVFARGITGSAAGVGDVVYSVNNWEVSTDSNGGTRKAVGRVSEVRDSKPYVEMGPTKGAGLASTAAGMIPVPLGALRLSTGAAVAAFSDGVADGFQLTDSEALSLRINNASTTTFAITVPMPSDLDDAQDISVHFLGFRVGSADTTAAITVGAFFHTVGAADSADADAGGASSAFAAATTIVSESTLTIDAADVPAAPCDLTLTFTVTAALDADDLCITSAWIEYQAK